MKATILRMHSALLSVIIVFFLIISRTTAWTCGGHSIKSELFFSKRFFRSHLGRVISTTKRDNARCISEYSSNASFIEYHGWNQSKKLIFDEHLFKFREFKRTDLSSWCKSIVFSAFLPSGDINNQYLRYVRWRTIQRLISSTNNVFGTQALLLALGFKKKKIGAAVAASWVLKDTLGKLARVLWASSFGRKFDSNAKNWRFKAAILYALGNSLEVSTLLFPSWFIVTAAIGNALKQVAMLTASSTRNSIYKSFSGFSDNIGDITAKGEAQIAVIDILGMVLGVWISRLMDTSKMKVISIFVTLTAIDLFCVYKEIQSLNFGRSGMVLPAIIARRLAEGENDDLRPLNLASRENLLFSPKVDESVVKVWSTLSTAGFKFFRKIAQDKSVRPVQENFVVLLNLHVPDSFLKETFVRHGLIPNSWLGFNGAKPVILSAEVLLHKRASSFDLFRALIVIWKAAIDFEAAFGREVHNSTEVSLEDIAAKLRGNAMQFEKENAPVLKSLIEKLGWETKSFSFGSMRMRVDF